MLAIKEQPDIAIEIALDHVRPEPKATLIQLLAEFNLSVTSIEEIDALAERIITLIQTK